MEGNCDLQVKTSTRHSSGGTPLGKLPRFVVARSAHMGLWDCVIVEIIYPYELVGVVRNRISDS